jgi:hypothetical protein
LLFWFKGKFKREPTREEYIDWAWGADHKMMAEDEAELPPNLRK